MNLRRFLEGGQLRQHRSSPTEIRDLFRVVDRDLKDAAVRGVSDDLRFQQAYQAVLTLGKAILAAAGYRTHGAGHHWVTFQALREILGPDFHETLDYFESCRGKRNVLEYDRAGEVSEANSGELLGEARRFRSDVLKWLAVHHPALTRR